MKVFIFMIAFIVVGCHSTCTNTAIEKAMKINPSHELIAIECVQKTREWAKALNKLAFYNAIRNFLQKEANPYTSDGLAKRFVLEAVIVQTLICMDKEGELDPIKFIELGEAIKAIASEFTMGK